MGAGSVGEMRAAAAAARTVWSAESWREINNPPCFPLAHVLRSHWLEVVAAVIATQDYTFQGMLTTRRVAG